MAAQLAVQEYHRNSTALTPAYTAANASGEEFENEDGDVLLLVKNVSGGAITLTVQLTDEVDDVQPQKTVSIADTTSTAPAVIGPFPSGTYNDSNEEVQIGWSSVVSVTVAAVKPKAV